MGIILDNQHISELLEQVESQIEPQETALYEQYKNVVKICESPNFRGSATDTIKTYLSSVTINHINTYLNVLTALKDSLTSIKDRFLEFESHANGKVSDTDLNNVKSQVVGKETTFHTISGTLAGLTSEASAYISVTNILTGNVDYDFNDVKQFLTTTNDDLTSVDTENLQTANDLFAEVQAFFTSVSKTTAGYFDSTGNIRIDKVANIQQEDWYTEQPRTTLERLVVEDPFYFDSSSVAVSEDQVAKGWAKDTFVTAGYSFLGADSQVEVEDGKLTATGSAHVLKGNASGQLTEYVKGEVSGDVLSASGTLESGFSDGYYGAALEGQARGAGADGSLQLGSDELNFNLNGTAEVAAANGFAKAEFEDTNNYAIGFKGEATAAQVEGGFEFDLFSIQDASHEYKEYDTSGNKTYEGKNSLKDSIPLLGLSGDVSAGVSAGAGLYAETKQAKAFGPLSINSTTLHVSGKLGLGFELNLTIPTLGLDFW